MKDILLGFLAGVMIVLTIAGLMTCVATAAEYRIVDRVGNVVMPVEHGTTIDLHDLADRKFLKLEASFGDELAHATWVDFTLIHSAGTFDYEHTDMAPEAGWWQVCPNRCFRLTDTGSVMLKSKVWWGDNHPTSQATGVIGTDSVTFRVTDSKPRIRPPSPSRTRRPTCHGDPDVCKEIVGTGLWTALSRLCGSRPGADISLGNGASMRCP